MWPVALLKGGGGFRLRFPDRMRRLAEHPSFCQAFRLCTKIKRMRTSEDLMITSIYFF
jgi:hypothetical protein